MNQGDCILNDLDVRLKNQENTEYRNTYYQELLILEVTEIIVKLMKKHGVSKTVLAEKLGKGRSYVTQLLDGTSNMTLRTISDVFIALDSMMIPFAGPLSMGTGQVYDDSYYEFEDENQSVQSGVAPEQLICGVFGDVEYIKDMAA